MALRYTVHPEHTRSLPSMAPRYTVHPEHKKAHQLMGLVCYKIYLLVNLLFQRCDKYFVHHRNHLTWQ
jgi:hypothetical protein